MLFPEIFSLIGGSVTGFIFKMLAQMAADRQKTMELLIKKQQADDASSDLAAKRNPGKAGEITRRIIIVSILFGVILAPFILALLNKPVVIETVTPIRNWIFGLFSTGGITQFYELRSYVLIPEIRCALLALIGFYFGNSSAKRSNL